MGNVCVSQGSRASSAQNVLTDITAVVICAQGRNAVARSVLTSPRSVPIMLLGITLSVQLVCAPTGAKMVSIQTTLSIPNASRVWVATADAEQTTARQRWSTG
jgi:hypothetical protein